MGLGFEVTKKSRRLDESRPAEYGSWLTKYSTASTQASNSWTSAKNNMSKSSNGQVGNNPWGPVFKSKQNFIDMHFS